MAQIESLFVTRLYHAKLAEYGKPIDPNELEVSCYHFVQQRNVRMLQLHFAHYGS